ncbi:hypothetical protein [Tropicibacter sp. S64]|uniref:hypothetical protein n=1 Tax=Tropicibacter sp. S64 TaxID=3415122 RepID=UPI003C7B19CF
MMARAAQWMTRMALPLALAGALAGCADFPELDAAQTPGIETAAYPKLVSLDGLLVGPEPVATVEMIGAVQGRVSGLKARADRLRRVRAAPPGVSARLAQLRQKAAALRAVQ